MIAPDYLFCAIMLSAIVAFFAALCADSTDGFTEVACGIVCMLSALSLVAHGFIAFVKIGMAMAR